MNYKEWLAQAIVDLAQKNPTENSKIDALVLLQHATGKLRTQILAFDDTEIDEKVRLKLTALLDRRLKGEPIAYILGEKEFWSLPLNVSKSTLIPRPDTESLVEKALQIALEKLEENPPHFRILDLGTGTGAIALALASELEPICQKRHIPLEIIGVDLMPDVVALAQSNAERNQLNVEFLQSRWFDNITGKFDLIVSNPPYIDAQDEHLHQGDVRFEPLSALVANDAGYADLRHIIELASSYLNSNGVLLLEHGWQQGEKVRSIFQENHWEMVETVRDYSDNERVTLGFWKKECNIIDVRYTINLCIFILLSLMMAAQKHNFGEKWVGLCVKRVKKFRQIGRKKSRFISYYSYFMVIGAFIAIQKIIFMLAIYICLMCLNIVKECQ